MEEKRFINIQLFADEEETAEAIEETVEAEEQEAEEPEAEDTFEIEKDEEEIPEQDEEDEEEQPEEAPEEEAPEVETAEPIIEEVIEQPKEDVWKQKYEQLQRETLKAVKSFGIEVNDTESVEDILDKTQAEFEGLSVEEYRQKKEEQELLEKSKALIQQQKYEQICAIDLMELKKSFPQLAALKHIKEIGSFDEFKKFGTLRDKGLTVKEAYMATVGEKLMNTQELAVRQAAINNSKEHLRATAKSKQTTNGYENMPEADRILWKGYFPNASKKEMAKLYFDSKKKII